MVLEAGVFQLELDAAVAILDGGESRGAARAGAAEAGAPRDGTRAPGRARGVGEAVRQPGERVPLLRGDHREPVALIVHGAVTGTRYHTRYVQHCIA